jgi:hypothetical protein
MKTRICSDPRTEPFPAAAIAAWSFGPKPQPPTLRTANPALARLISLGLGAGSLWLLWLVGAPALYALFPGPTEVLSAETARATNPPPPPLSPPAPRALPVYHLGDSFSVILPDGRQLNATERGSAPASGACRLIRKSGTTTRSPKVALSKASPGSGIPRWAGTTRPGSIRRTLSYLFYATRPKPNSTRRARLRSADADLLSLVHRLLRYRMATKALLRCGVIGTATVTFFWLLLLSRASSGSDYDTALTVGLPGGLLSSVAGAPPPGGQMNLPDHILAALEAEERGAHYAEYGFPPEPEYDLNANNLRLFCSSSSLPSDHSF